MIETSAAYKAAITGDARRTLLKAVIDIIDPDLTYQDSTSSGEAAFSKKEELYDKNFKISQQYATLEANRWLLDGKVSIIPDNNNIQTEVGFVGNQLSDENGDFSTAQWAQINFSNTDVLQAFSVYFSNHEIDGVPRNFIVEIYQGGTAYYTKEITGNSDTKVSFTGFTVYNPDAIRITVFKWSLPKRRMRVPEILPGVYEEWGEDIIAHFDVKQQGDVSCLALPYGVCTLRMDNFDRRFEPRNKDGIFLSLEDRQGIDVSIGTRLSNGADEFRHVGTFYQYSGGWKTSDNNLTMEWKLVDIVGLLANREYIPPATLPNTLSGWVASIVAQLGESFKSSYIVDPAYSSVSMTANKEEVTGLRCGEILRYVCMASGTWPRADASTGKLAVEPLWSQGNKVDLDNLSAYPIMSANADIAAIVFTLADENNTQYVVSGNSVSSSDTKSVKNPFIKTQAQALTAAKNILATFGGNRLETIGRGDPSSEIGDVDTVELDESSATTGRRIFQTFTISDGVLKDCQSVLLQADGSFLYQNREVITESGTWTAPAGVRSLRVVIGNGGGGGTNGTDGTWEEAGTDGVDGSGGKIWFGTISINEKQTFSVTIGNGGGVGQSGGVTTFGSYSGSSGKVFTPSYTDIASGEAFGRTGVLNPVDGSSDGGARGAGGVKGNKHTERVTSEEEDGSPVVDLVEVIDNYPGKGADGTPGASGFVVVYWDR